MPIQSAVLHAAGAYRLVTLPERFRDGGPVTPIAINPEDVSTIRPVGKDNKECQIKTRSGTHLTIAAGFDEVVEKLTAPFAAELEQPGQLPSLEEAQAAATRLQGQAAPSSPSPSTTGGAGSDVPPPPGTDTGGADTAKGKPGKSGGK